MKKLNKNAIASRIANEVARTNTLIQFCNKFGIKFRAETIEKPSDSDKADLLRIKIKSKFCARCKRNSEFTYTWAVNAKGEGYSFNLELDSDERSIIDEFILVIAEANGIGKEARDFLYRGVVASQGIYVY